MFEAGQGALSLPQVAEIAGLERATLHSWVKRGLIRASIQNSTGTGRPNVFTYGDALAIRVLADLRRTGVELDALQRAAEKLDEKRNVLAGDEVLVVNGSVDLLTSDQPIADVLQERQAAVCYELAWAREAVEEGASP
jgi:DNA-binding transcriptional MerR regulator